MASTDGTRYRMKGIGNETNVEDAHPGLSIVEHLSTKAIDSLLVH